MEEGEPLITFNNIAKRYKIKKQQNGVKNLLKGMIKPEYYYKDALKGVSFNVDEGEIIGYIGPNGAGKSTTIKIMTGILTPDSGECKVLGFTPSAERKKYVRNIGVVFGNRSQLLWDLPIIDSFYLLKKIYKIPDSVFNKNVESLSKMIGINELLNIPTRQLSLGQRMRCEIVAALLHEPKILFLDEPTLGLDAISKVAVRNFIKEINSEKKITVILTTHDMSDIDALVDRIILIGSGTKLYDGSLDEVKKKYSKLKKLIVSISNSRDELKNLEKLDGVRIIQLLKNQIVIEYDSEKISVEKILANIKDLTNIMDWSINTLNIEEIITKFYQMYNV